MKERELIFILTNWPQLRRKILKKEVLKELQRKEALRK